MTQAVRPYHINVEHLDGLSMMLYFIGRLG